MVKKRYGTLLAIGAILGFLISEFRPKVPHETPDLSHYQKTRDSLEAIILTYSDSLNAARFVLSNRERELEAAHKRTAQALKSKNEIRFITYPTDSARMAAWAEFFPSLKHR